VALAVVGRLRRPAGGREVRELHVDGLRLGLDGRDDDLLRRACALGECGACEHEQPCGDDDGELHDSNLKTSPSSGQRPARCLENTVSPSLTTSNCDFSPLIGAAWMPAAWSSAARLAARAS